MSDKINKAYEVALACAAQDGLSPPELMSMVDSVQSVPLLAPVLQTMFEATGVEGDEINPIEAIEALSQLIEIINDLELTTIDDAYMEDATSVMGESAAINNLCAAMCLLFSGSDGEFSKSEGHFSGAFLREKGNLSDADLKKVIEKSQNIKDPIEKVQKLSLKNITGYCCIRRRWFYVTNFKKISKI